MTKCEHRLEKRLMKNKVCCITCYTKQHYIKNAESIKQYQKQHYIKNADKIKQRRNQYYIKNAESIKQYKKNNADKINQYRKQRRQSDPVYKMINNIRNRLYKYSKLKGNNKTWDLLGCNPIELRDWLQCQFKEGMNWDNHGEWHIDHILPLCAAENEEDFKILSHYTNLQPLWAEDNIKKGGR